jgi:hypothetical protein
MEINYCLKKGKGKGNLYLPSFVVTLFCRRALMSPRSYVAALLCRTLFCRALFLRRAFVAIPSGTPGITQEGEIIKNLNKGEFYKYLGINQSNQIQQSIIKENLEKQFYLRIKSKLLKTNKETLVQMPLFCAIFYETIYNFSTNIEILKSHSLQR